MAVETINLKKALSEENTRLKTLQKVSEAIHGSLDPEKVFGQITDGAVHSMDYITAFFIMSNKEKTLFEIKALSTKKRLLLHLDKALGFPLKNFSFQADPEINHSISSVLKGRMVVVSTLAEIAYPLISKKKCSSLQKLARTKNYIIVPLKVGEEITGGVFISSSRNEVSEEELRMLESFANAASNAIFNAKLHEQIKASLREKDVMLKEIHHRVKNNIQIISSLIKLQSRNIKDEQAQEIFKSTQSRVRSMALIHEKLYRSKDLAQIDLAEYVQSLTAYLSNFYRSKTNFIKYHTSIKDVSLDINTAIPCGLIINELISNSLKYAFPNGKKGEIKISVQPLNKKELEMIVSDNGVGLPKKIDFRSTETLGLHLVTILAEDQLRGKIKLDRTKGTRFQIRFEP
jgi:two-component sensor histidine kinase